MKPIKIFQKRSGAGEKGKNQRQIYGRIKNARKKPESVSPKNSRLKTVRFSLRSGEKIKHRTRYHVEFSTAELIRRTVAELQDFNKVPKNHAADVGEARTARLNYTGEGIDGTR